MTRTMMVARLELAAEHAAFVAEAMAENEHEHSEARFDRLRTIAQELRDHAKAIESGQEWK